MSRTKWILVGVGGAIVSAILIANAVDDSDTREFGDATVEISTTPDASDAENIRDVILQFNEQAGVTPDVIECIEGELDQVPDSEFERLIELAEDQGLEAAGPELQRFGAQIQRPCIRGQVVGEDLDENQIELLREASLRQLDALASRFPAGLLECLRARVEAMSPGELIEASNETIRENTARWARYGRECDAAGDLG